MLTERLQVLLSRAQRRRLEAEARRTHRSVGALIRDALDSRLSSVPPERRRRAVAEIKGMRGGRFLSPSALERVIDRERDTVIRRSRRRRVR